MKKILISIYEGFKEHQIQLNSATLTYYTLLAIVPIFTLLLIIADNLQLEEYVKAWLQDIFKEQHDISTYLINFADNALQKTEKALFKIVGVALLLWAAIKMLLYVDVSINQLWNKPFKPKFLIRKARFFVMLLVCPLLFLLASGITLYLSMLVHYLMRISPWLQEVNKALLFLSNIFPSLITFFLLSFLYYFVPYPPVKVKHALLSGLITAIGYQLVQYGYFSLQVSVATYSTIYGTFAAIPLFLVWVHLSWIIFLVGAKLCYSLSN